MRHDGAKAIFKAKRCLGMGQNLMPWHGAKLELPHKFSLNVEHALPKWQGAVLLRGDHL